MQLNTPSATSRSAGTKWRAIGILVCMAFLAGSLGLLPAAHAKPVLQAVDDTTIVYVTSDARSLRLIQPDGSNDRLLWQVPDSIPGSPIESVMWRPDARQIAFASSHEATCSEYGADIYLINPDGSNLRRLTNGPACAALASYPQGSATVQIRNQLTNFSEYLVYIEGAPTAKVVTIAPGSTTTVAFPQVADLGAGVLQMAVAINGTTRWFDAAVQADVVAGQNVHAGLLTISGGGFAAYGATHASWSPDGSRLAYQLGQGRLMQVGLDVPLLGEGGPLLAPQVNDSIVGVYPVWSPVGNEVLYQRSDTTPFTINAAEVGGNSSGNALANVTNTSGIAWITDGSGMVVADFSDPLLTRVDLYRMTFADNNIVQLTQTSGQQGAFLPSVSPDGSQIVYGFTQDIAARPFSAQLRIMNIDGGNDRLLAADGRRASWSRVAPQVPQEPTVTPPTPAPTATPDPALKYKIYLPVAIRQPGTGV
jgi:TolB protein